MEPPPPTGDVQLHGGSLTRRPPPFATRTLAPKPIVPSGGPAARSAITSRCKERVAVPVLGTRSSVCYSPGAVRGLVRVFSRGISVWDGHSDLH
eukprot:14695360-Alexandrium_andersonii.AAC.1